jgi:DNA-binding response OmpR family regulator
MDMTIQQIATENESDAILLTEPRAKILIVDDEARIRLSLRSCLEAEGYEVDEAADGVGALRAIADMKPDLVLLDLSMPRLDGMAMLREWRARFAERLSMPRVVVLTAWGSAAVEEEAFLCGVRDFIAKPLSPRALREVVERVLHQPPALPVREEDDTPGNDDDDDDRPFGHLFFG